MKRIKKDKYFQFAQFLGVTKYTRKREVCWLRLALWVDAKKVHNFTNEVISSWSGHNLSRVSTGHKSFIEMIELKDEIATQAQKELIEKKNEFFKLFPEVFEEVI